MTRTERELKAAKTEAARYANETQEVWKKAKEDDDRDLTAEEREEVLTNIKNMETCKERISELDREFAVEQEVKRVGREVGAPESSGLEFTDDVKVVAQSQSIGEIFVQSPQFKSIQSQGGQFSTGPVELLTKGTLLSGTSAPGSGSGGGLLTVPQVAGGVVTKLFQGLTVADLIASGSTNTNTIRYVVEGTATSGAAGVAEGAAKPESTLGLSTLDEPVKKIATTLVISDEMLEDASQVESYINGRLSLFIRIEEERELVLGGGTNELVGIAGRSGVNTYTAGTVDNSAVALFKAINGTRGSALLEPDAVVIHPTDWQRLRLLTDTAGQFFGGGPFQGPYGNGQVDPASGQLTGAMDHIWNKPVVVTTAIGAGTALLGAFRTCAQIFRRSGTTVEATNSHSDYFTKNLVAIRAEQRLALAVYRPSAFTKVVW